MARAAYGLVAGCVHNGCQVPSPLTLPPRTTPAGLCGSVSCLTDICISNVRSAFVYRAVAGVIPTGLKNFMPPLLYAVFGIYGAKPGDDKCAVVQSFRRHNRYYDDTIIPGTIRYHTGAVRYDTPACLQSVVYGAAPIRRGTLAQPII